MRKAVLFLVVVGGGLAYYRYFYLPAKRERVGWETAYVVPDSLPVVDTTAMIRRVLATYHSGQAVEVEARIGEWAKIALPGGSSGWVKQKELIDGAVYQKGQDLIKNLETRQVQAQGRTNQPVNLHLDPSRESLKLGEYNQGEAVDIYDRRVVTRGVQPAQASLISDVWYLVSGGRRGGWLLGQFVDLSIPPGLAAYAQGVNMVAWLTLDSVADGGRQVPQYIAADRIGAENVDFNHIRVFTWWVKRHEYVTAYVESGLDGYFPITVTHSGGVPYFRLRLVDDEGNKFQKVYGLYDTIVKSLGTVPGWTSTAMPAPPTKRGRGLRRSRSARVQETRSAALF